MTEDRNPHDLKCVEVDNASTTHAAAESFDVRKYLPPGIKVDLVEKGGALFIPHRINEFAVKVLKKKVSLLVFQCMLRYSLGFNRPTCKLSNGFIAKWTGLLIPNVRKGLRELKEMGLVRIARHGTSTTATIYDIPIVRGFLEWRDQKEQGLNQGGIKSIPGHIEVGLNQSPKRDWAESTGKSNAIPKKENGKKTLKKTLSQLDTLPTQLKSYILDVRPHQKRVEEEYHLTQLLLDYRSEDINDALAFVTKHGALETGEPVHSPMKYLSFAAEQVISESKKRHEKLKRAEQLRIQIEHHQTEEQAKRQKEEEEYNVARGQFESVLNQEEQVEILNNYYQENYSGSPGIPKNVVKRLAIADWFKRQNEREL